MTGSLQIWDLWYPGAAATGLPFARGRLDATGVLLVHAAPDALDVVVRTVDGQLLAEGQNLTRIADTPMTRLSRRGTVIDRHDLWPSSEDIGRPVILPGGEVGILIEW